MQTHQVALVSGIAVCIGTWLREQSLFDLLSSKRISKTWLLGKLFKIWRGFTRRNHFARMQRSFAAQSFLAKPLFCTAILQLRKTTQDMAKVQLMDVQPGKAHHLEVQLPQLLYILVYCTSGSHPIIRLKSIVSSLNFDP